MQRVAFTMRLKPGGLAAYRKLHDRIWPELVEQLGASGIRNMTIFEQDPVLFLYSEVEDAGAWDRLWHSEIQDRWGELMNPLMAFREDGIVDSTPLNEVFHIEPAAR